MIISQLATSSPPTILSNEEEDQNINRIFLTRRSLGYDYTDIEQINRSLSITNLFYQNHLRLDPRDTNSPPLLVCSTPLPIHSPKKSPNSPSKNCFDLNPHNSTVYKNRLYLETSFDVNPPFTDSQDSGNYSETLCLEAIKSSINLNPNYTPCHADETNFQNQQSFDQNLRTNSCISLSDLDVKGVTVGGELVNIELPEGTSSVIGVWTLGLGLLGDSESDICCRL